MKIGDKVDYLPRRFADTHQPLTDVEIIQYMPRGEIFNQDMAVIEGCNYWVPACDLHPT